MRKTPYTQIGIRRLKCFRCGEKAVEQWQICSDGNIYRPICLKCDIELNELVLNFMGFPNVADKMKAYKAKKV
jgi:late competence protein required for DNA uptake (superfamily II DNA/RNA helicase)